MRDMFEAFVKEHFLGDATAMILAFRMCNKLRNDVFHEARYASVDRDAAETAYTLLDKCLRAELTSMLTGDPGLRHDSMR